MAAQDLAHVPQLLDDQIRAWSGGVAVGDDVTVVVMRIGD
jgi:hypothetical protein